MSAAATKVDHFADIVTVAGARCPSCAKAEPRIFYEVADVPVHDARLVSSYEEAVRCPKGDIQLALCVGCGFIWNIAFDPALVEYMDDYEATQAFSPTFNAFHRKLARYLVDLYGLAGKSVIEVGCGEGEFLLLLKELGVRQATGFDPVARGLLDVPADVTVVKDWYSEKYAGLRSDLVLSKMVMEHIPDAGRFLRMLRRSLEGRTNVAVFAMIPEVTRILKLRAFWDIYYEHCTYYSPGSLARAFRSAGFDTTSLSTEFGDQYVAISAVPGEGAGAPLAEEETPAQLARMVDDFADHIDLLHLRWREWVRSQRDSNRRVVLWGGGSKAVAFLTTLGLSPEDMELVVDINPRRAGTYVSGTGQRIVEPEFLRRCRPDAVVIMNPNYRGEIAAQLEGMGLAPQLLSVEDHLAG